MTAYFIRRFLLIIPTFIGITVMVFVITRSVPGCPVERKGFAVVHYGFTFEAVNLWHPLLSHN